MIRRLDSERLENILLAFYQPAESDMGLNLRTRIVHWLEIFRRPED
jgi:hypothetical protein